MTIVQLRIFSTIAEMKNFTDVAVHLGITQSAVSHALSSLEKELGLPLINRDRRGIVPTDAGERILGHAREILVRSDRIQEVVAGLSGLRIGKVRVGTLQSAAIRLLPGVISTLRQKYPCLEVSLFEGTDQEIQDWLVSDTVDVGVMTAPCDHLESIPLLEDRFFALFPEAHPLGDRPSLCFDDLKSEPFIRSTGTCGTLVISDLLQRDHGKDKKVVEPHNISTVAAMLRAGVGCAILPELAIPKDKSGMKIVPIEPPLIRKIVLSSTGFDSLSPATRTFVDQLRESVRLSMG